MSQPRSSPAELSYPATGFERFLWRRRRRLAFASFAVAFVAAIITESYVGMQGGIREAHQSSQLQSVHALGLALYLYATDHDNKYPQGNSSTEVFQQLLDQGYVSDPGLFYYSLPGKTKATGSKLKPENVCWDVTGDLTVADVGELPLVFGTGFKVKYAPGGSAGVLSTAYMPDGVAVFFVNNFAKFVTANEGHVLIFNGTFDPQGKTYRQLTPDGPLP